MISLNERIIFHHSFSIPFRLSQHDTIASLGQYTLFGRMHKELGYVPPNFGHTVIARVEIPAQHAHQLEALVPVLDEKVGLVRVLQSEVSAK